MKNKKYILLLILFISTVSVWYFYTNSYKNDDINVKEIQRIKSSSSPKSIEGKKARAEYFLHLLMDPKTGKVPAGIRQKELEFAKIIAQRNLSLKKTTQQLQWQEIGPYDVGGRTRALAVDITNPNTILAGGISGGIWKSTDHGNSWKLKNISSDVLSVTSIAQDPRPGHTNTWYYSTGEYYGNSASDRGKTSLFSGNGVYKSTDNGETWSVLPSTLSNNPTSWESPFDYTSKIIVSPVTGSIFVASNQYGIFRSGDGGNTFSFVIGKINEHTFNEIDVGKNGVLLATLSSSVSGGVPEIPAGLYKSVDDGQTWSNITPQNFPDFFYRSVIAIAPSNPDAAYIFMHTGDFDNNNSEINRFYKFNIANGASADLSNNLPDFSFSLGGYVNSQGAYNMTIGIKPDDENLVLIGASSLFRSFDGFQTKPADKKVGWIGGYYDNLMNRYKNLHPDIHAFAFDPVDSKKIWVGHDGGLSYTDDITNTSYEENLPWETKNNGYNVTQFYMVAMPSAANDPRIMGGCQDNGTPYFTWDGNNTSSSADVSSGDGAHAYFGNQFAYTSSQNGFLLRLRYDQDGKPDIFRDWSRISPTEAANQLFINPFAVDPSDENIMYYPAGNVLWRNNDLSAIPNYEQNGTTVGWSKLEKLNVSAGYNITALTASTNPAHVLYYGASSSFSPPKLFRFENANTAVDGAVEITIPGAPSGAYIHNIAVNPDNADEILVTLSNYNIVGLFHSTNGGQTLTPVEGNLEGTQQSPGPSIRAATILPTENGNIYLLATSIGVFSSPQLNGGATNWIQESANGMGNVVVNHITSRKTDKKVVAGTHGRGAFIAQYSGGTGTAQLSISTQQLNISVQPGQTNTVPLKIENLGSGNLDYSINITQPTFLTVDKSNKEKILLPVKGEWGFRKNLPLSKSSLKNKVANPVKVAAELTLINDDGNNMPDDFFGNGGTFYWLSLFNPQDEFTIEKVYFYMRTEDETENPLYFSVNDIVDNQLSQPVYEAQLTGSTSSNGTWLEYNLPQPITFAGGKNIAIIIGSGTGIQYPAGFDTNGSRPGNSFYFDASSNSWIALQNAGFVNGAWLVRLYDSGGGTNNQQPVASAQITPNPVGINQTVTFDASGSNDPDGQIVSYSWNFGDGNTSDQKVASHSYTQAGNYNYVLTVTDNEGLTGQATGTVNVTTANTARLTVNPQTGTVAPNSSNDIQVTFDAQGLQGGSYTGQLTINSNGGNALVTVKVNVSTSVDVDNDNLANSLPVNYQVMQNHPNPFNPSTVIKYSLPFESHVVISIYNINGERIDELLNRNQSPGNYNINFSARNLASGVYIYSVEAVSLNGKNKFHDAKKMVYLK